MFKVEFNLHLFIISSLITLSMSLDTALASCQFSYKDLHNGNLRLPSFQLDQSPYQSCAWTIKMQKSHTVALSLIDMQIGSKNTLLIEDYSYENQSRLLKSRKFNNIAQDVVVFSVAEILRVKLLIKQSENISFNAIFEDAFCGGTMTDPSGDIEVPLFVHLSPFKQTCIWALEAPTQKIIKLSALQFFVQEGSCLFENLSIKDGLSNNDPKIGDFCEENPPVGDTISSRNSMRIEYEKHPSFLSFPYSNMPKVRLHYEFIDSCGSKLMGMYGTLTVPSVDMTFKSQCDWRIEVPQQYVVTMKFLKYTIARKDHGGQQSLNVYDGKHENDSVLIWSSLHDPLPPTEILSSSNGIRIEIITWQNQSANNRVSFQAFYQATAKTSSYFDECINIGSRSFFKCSNGHYIDCDWKCDGEIDCEDGMDELFCLNAITELDIIENIGQESIKKTVAILTFMALGFAIFACFIALSFDKMFRSSDNSTSMGENDQWTEEQFFDANELDFLPPYSVIDPVTGNGPASYHEKNEQIESSKC